MQGSVEGAQGVYGVGCFFECVHAQVAGCVQCGGCRISANTVLISSPNICVSVYAFRKYLGVSGESVWCGQVVSLV